jgi:hypothetical protein
MMTWLRRYNRQILIFTFGMFILGGVVFTGLEGALSLTPMSPVAEVNGRKIPFKLYQARMNQNIQRQEKGEAMTAEKMQSLKQSTLQELIQEAAFLEEADRYGVEATDAEVAAYLQNAPAFQRDGRFDQSLYFQALQMWRTTPAVFEEEQRQFIRRQKLLMLLGSGVQVSSHEAAQFMAWNAGRLTPEQKKELSSSPDTLKQAVTQEQANGAVRAWLGQLGSRIKVQNHLDRWEKQGQG